jgi:hypothetical protein
MHIAQISILHLTYGFLGFWDEGQTKSHMLFRAEASNKHMDNDRRALEEWFLVL